MKRGPLFYVILASAVIILLSAGVYTSVTSAKSYGHESEQVYIKYGNDYVTLQHAFDRSYLSTSYSEVLLSVVPDNLLTNIAYHTADNVLVEVDGYTMTLQEAVDNDALVNGAVTDYATSLLAWHSADDIIVDDSGTDRTLQELIDLGRFKAQTQPQTQTYYAWFAGSWTRTEESCPTTYTREVYCEEVYYESFERRQVSDDYCSDPKPASSAKVNCYWDVTVKSCTSKPKSQLPPECKYYEGSCDNYGEQAHCTINPNNYNCDCGEGSAGSCHGTETNSLYCWGQPPK